jgi:hypothetical protein
MVYRVDIEEDFDRDPVGNAFNDETIRFGLGVDFDSDIEVFMAVSFIRKEPEVYELRFGTEERRLSRDEWSFGMDYSIDQSKKYVPKPHRGRVLELLLESIESILKKCTPRLITMTSFYKQLPDKAMVKYREICILMMANGYEVKEDFVDGTTGTHYWLFKRSS